MDLEPQHTNILASLVTVAYVKVVIGVCDLAVSKKWLPAKISRKVIHVCAASWIIFWPLFDTSHWTWQLNVLVPVVYSIQLFVKGLILQDRNDADVRSMSRTGNPLELCFGPLWFTFVMTFCGLKLFRKPEGVWIMACLGFGDGIAPLVGQYFPYGTVGTFPFGPKDKKTLSGMAGFLAASMVGIWLLSTLLLSGKAGKDENFIFDWSSCFQVSLVASIVELSSGYVDNILIPVAVSLTMRHGMD